MRVALVSLDQEWLDKDNNFKNCYHYVQQANEQKCDLIVFPEMTLTGFAPEISSVIEDASNSETLERFRLLSDEFNISIIYGVCLLLDGNDKPSNVICYSVPGKKSEIIYSKCHLFSYSGEDKYIEPGNETATIELDGMNVGLGICYDLRFPGLFSSMNHLCEGFIIIANWPDKRTDHWNSLLKARAIENLSFVIGVNRTGVDGNGLSYDESSHVYMPNGMSINYMDKLEQLCVYEIDRKEIKTQRASFTTIVDQRPELYYRSDIDDRSLFG